MLDEKTYRQFIEAVELTDVVLSKVSLQLDRLDTSLPSSLAADTKFKSSRVMLDDNVLRLRGSFTVIGHTSVSYTHLDVYKRQGCTGGRQGTRAQRSGRPVGGRV